MASEPFDVNALASAITAGIRATVPTPGPTVAELLQRPENLEPVLDRPVFQNGQPIQIRGCSQDTIKHCNALQPGEYLGGAIKVVRRGQPPNEEIHIVYPWASIDERMKIYGLVSSFSDMVAKIDREYRERQAAQK